MMAVAFLALALIPNLQKMVVPFLIIYGLSFFFTDFGPNATTFVYPSEVFPVRCGRRDMESPPPSVSPGDFSASSSFLIY
jgi:hypothetical protein